MTLKDSSSQPSGACEIFSCFVLLPSAGGDGPGGEVGGAVSGGSGQPSAQGGSAQGQPRASERDTYTGSLWIEI